MWFVCIIHHVCLSTEFSDAKEYQDEENEQQNKEENKEVEKQKEEDTEEEQYVQNSVVTVLCMLIGKLLVVW